MAEGHPDRPRVLVVGIGNDLRLDYGAGQVVAQALLDASGAGPPGVQVCLVHQLLPELTELLRGHDRVVFVDAAGPPSGAGGDQRRVRVRPVTPAAGVVRGHHADPATLLGLLAHDGEPPPAAWLVTVPATDVGFGEGLSEPTAWHVPVAVHAVLQLITSDSPGT